MAGIRNTNMRWSRHAMARAGASLFAIAAMGATAPAWAQDAPAADAQAEDGGEELTITGRRAALQAADERKRNSESIINSVVADEAGKLPDNSITEVLQRVSGVSVV